jgi:hypothetical protein
MGHYRHGQDGHDAEITDSDADDRAKHRAAARSALPDPGPLAGRLAVGLVEALSGQRSPQQLAAWIHPDILTQLAAQFQRPAPPPLRPPKALRALPQEITPGVAEVAVVLHLGNEVRALGMRLEAHHGRWQAIQIAGLGLTTTTGERPRATSQPMPQLAAVLRRLSQPPGPPVASDPTTRPGRGPQPLRRRTL